MRYDPDGKPICKCGTIMEANRIWTLTTLFFEFAYICPRRTILNFWKHSWPILTPD
jgi:hypothetical protein